MYTSHDIEKLSRSKIRLSTKQKTLVYRDGSRHKIGFRSTFPKTRSFEPGKRSRQEVETKGRGRQSMTLDKSPPHK